MYPQTCRRNKKRSFRRTIVKKKSNSIPQAILSTTRQSIAYFLNVAVKRNPDYLQQSLPKPGQIRFFQNVFTHLGPAHLAYISVKYYDRTYTEWQQCIQQWNSYTFVGIPWRQLSQQLHDAFMFELKLRWIARKFIARLREKAYQRRSIGIYEDLYTLEPISPCKQVRVIDIYTRSIYFFHINTIVRSIKASLYYSNYGIANPIQPKNPFTNLHWKKHQLMSITQQIGNIYWNSHTHIPFEIIELRTCQYDVAFYFEKNRKLLQINAAKSYFENYNESYDVYEDIITDLYDDCVIEQIHITDWLQVRPFLFKRKLSVDLLKEFNDIVVIAWIYENHNFCYKIKNYMELLYKFELLVSTSHNWLISTCCICP